MSPKTERGDLILGELEAAKRLIDAGYEVTASPRGLGWLLVTLANGTGKDWEVHFEGVAQFLDSEKRQKEER
jgi:hypothetical protein